MIYAGVIVLQICILSWQLLLLGFELGFLFNILLNSVFLYALLILLSDNGNNLARTVFCTFSYQTMSKRVLIANKDVMLSLVI